MSKVVLIVLVTLAVLSTAFSTAYCAGAADPANTLTAAEKAAGWKLLFDGKTLDGWGCTQPDSKGWVIENGAIYYNREGGGYLYTKDRFSNFELNIDFMVDRRTNSGLFFRWDKLEDPVQTGIEMQILDSARKKVPDKHDCGAIYDVLAPSENAMRPALEWNSVVLKCRNQFITITMNGKTIIRMDLDKYTREHYNIDGTRNKYSSALKDFPRKGHIGLQAHGGKVWFRNVKIRELD